MCVEAKVDLGVFLDSSSPQDLFGNESLLIQLVQLTCLLRASSVSASQAGKLEVGCYAHLAVMWSWGSKLTLAPLPLSDHLSPVPSFLKF